MKSAYLCSLIVASVITSAAPAQAIPRLPSDCRLLVHYEQAAFIQAEWLKKDVETYKPIIEGMKGPLTTLAVDPAKVEQAWLALGENYPRGSLLVIQGGIEAAKVNSRAEQLVRDRKFAARSYRDRGVAYFSLEIPVAANPIPGFPATVFLGLDPDNRLAAALDKDTLLTAISAGPPGNWPPALEPLKDQLSAPLALVLVPPAAATEPMGLFAGIKSVTGRVEPADGLRLQIKLAVSDTAALAERTKAGVEQARQVFPPLATQQGMNPKTIRFLTEWLNALNIEAADGEVHLKAELSAATLKAALGKP